MTRPARPVPTGLRVVRGGLFATTVAALAVAAHHAAGGAVPGAASTLMLTMGIAIAATALADRRRHPLTVAATMGGAQLAMHRVLDVAAAHDAMPDPAVVDGRALLVAHTAAAVLTALLLTTADTSLVALAAALRTILPPTRPFVLAHAEPGPAPVGAATVDPIRAVVLHRSCARRGPPQPC